MPVIPDTQVVQIGGPQSRLALSKKRDPISQINKAERARGVIKAREHLPHKRESLRFKFPALPKEKRYVKNQKSKYQVITLFCSKQEK
jgi:hypothetical protein